MKYVGILDSSILVLFWLFCLKVTIVRFFGGRPAARKDNLLFPQANDPKLAGVSLRYTVVTSCTDLYCSFFLLVIVFLLLLLFLLVFLSACVARVAQNNTSMDGIVVHGHDGWLLRFVILSSSSTTVTS